MLDDRSPLYADVVRGRGGIAGGLFTTANEESTVVSPIPAQFAYFDGASGSFISTPDSAAVSITGDIQFIFKIRLPSYRKATSQEIIGKRNTPSNDGSYNVGLVATTGVLRVNTFSLGTLASAVTRDSTASLATVVFDNESIWCRIKIDVDNGAAGSDTTFDTSTDYDADAYSGTWTPLGATVTVAGVDSIYNSVTTLNLGANLPTGTNNMLAGRIYRAQIFNSLTASASSLKADFNAEDADLTTSIPSTVTSSRTGEVWTMNGNAGIRRQ